MNGLQLAERMRADPQLAPIPIILYSGHYDPAAIAAKIGAVACLKKPIDVDELLILLSAHC